MRIIRLDKKVLIGTILGITLSLAAAISVSARDYSREYLKWQDAKTQADARYNEYVSTGSSSDYRKWQKAQARLEKRHNKLINAGGDISDIDDSDVHAAIASTGDTASVYVEPAATPMVYISSVRAEKAKEAVRMGYMYGQKKGAKDGRKGRDFSPTARLPYRDPYETPVIASHKYRRYYDQGYLRGYEDGYYSTQKYGMVYEGRRKGYSVYSGVENSLVYTAG
jgi:hypothetical protein